MNNQTMKLIINKSIVILAFAILLLVGASEETFGQGSAPKGWSAYEDVKGAPGVQIRFNEVRKNFWTWGFVNNTGKIISQMSFTYTSSAGISTDMVPFSLKPGGKIGGWTTFASESPTRPQIVVTRIKFRGEPENPCDDLADYRDNDLFKEWDKARAKYQLSSSAKQEMKRLRDKLLSDNTWSTSDSSLLVGVVAANLKATAGLIENLLSLTPAGAVPGAAIDATKISAQQVYTALKTGKNINDVAKGEMLKVAAKEALSHAGDLGKSAGVIWDLSEDIKTMTDLKPQQDKLKATIREQLDSLDKSINKYESQMKNSSGKLEVINAVKEGIDSYCLRQK